ncbi:MAG: cysteine desulfurase family protein [Candidatus Cloacimonadales bacterium]
MKRVYFNNCLTSQPAEEVITAMLPFMREKFQFPENFVSTGGQINSDLAAFRKTIAESLGAADSELHFTNGGTSANNLAIKGYISENAGQGTHLIVSVVDYPDLLTNAAYFEKSGFDVTYLPADESGFVDPEDLREAIQEDTILFMTTMSNHTLGTMQPIKKYRQVLDAADQQIAMHVDACEAYGRYPLDVKDLGIDLLSISAHKIHGPKGVGALYIRKGIKIAPTKHGVNRLDEYETGAISIAAIAGFAKAVELIFSDFEQHYAHIRSLQKYLLEKIEATIPHTLLNGPRIEGRAPHNMNISFAYIEGEAIIMMLDMVGISAATGSACASKGLKANYVMMAIGRNHEQSHSSIKFTLSRYNTKAEIDYTVEKLAEIVQELRRRSPLYKEEN